MEIQDLVSKIKEAQDAYYNGEDVTMSDAEFDALWNELTEKDPTNPILHKVGQDSGSAFEKVQHIMPMTSQQKSTNAEEFRDWARKHPRDEYIVQNKCDGSSIELQYIDGVLTKAITRGNGVIGDDVTENIKQITNCPHILKDTSFRGAVRGEVVLFHDTFEKHFKDKANCRNAANGIMKRKNSKEAGYLSIIAYDTFRSIGKQFETEYEKFQWICDNGFTAVETYYMSDIEDIIKFRDELSTSRFKDVVYDIDGLVIKCPEVDFEDQKRDRPEKQIAFKFILSEQVTTVRSVEWSVNGKTRTPVANCDPVFLCGTNVKRANICNIGLIRKIGLKIGSKVVMVKRGEIIPKIERVVLTPPDAIDIQFPEVCECCGTKLVSTDTQLYCPNKNCPNTLIHRLIKWGSINDIYGLGPSVAEDLYNNGIKTVKDLYKASVSDISKAIKSDKKAEKLKASIDKARNVPLNKFIAGYDLDEIGVVTINNIYKALPKPTLKSFLDITNSELESCSGFSEISAENICSQFKEFKSDLIDLSIIVGVKMPNTKSEKITYDGGVSHLFDVHVAFTGELTSMKRSKAEEMLRDVGGFVDSKVTKKTKFVVSNGPSTSSKYTDAVANGVEIINEEDFFKLLRGSW